MKRLIFPLSIFAITLLSITVSLQLDVLAQPAIDEPWEPETPTQEELPPGVVAFAGGPIQPGYGFVTYFEDRFGVRRADVYEDEMPVILVITLPPGLRNSWASCIQYYPPNYIIRNYLFRRINLGPSGTYRIGPFYQAPGEPYGKYAFRIGVLSVDSTGNMYWDEAVTFLEVKEKTVTITVTQERTVTQTVTGVTVMVVTQTIEKTLTTERTITQPTLITVEKPTLMTIEKVVMQTTTATTTVQAIEATTIPTIISIIAIVIVSILVIYILRIMKKK